MNCPHCRSDVGVGDHGAGVCNARGRFQPQRPEPLPAGMKRCSKCKTLKAASTDNFPRVRVTGLGSWCRTCCNKAQNDRNVEKRKTAAPQDPLKTAAWRFASAKKGTAREAQARTGLLDAVRAETDAGVPGGATLAVANG